MINFFYSRLALTRPELGAKGPERGGMGDLPEVQEIHKAPLNCIPRSGGVGDGKEKLWIYANFKYKIKSMIFIPYTKNGA
jgi:hypothetical protein